MSFDSRICTSCIQDEYLRREIDQHSGRIEECDFCEEVRPTIDLLDLANRCDEVIEVFFEVSSLTPAVVIYERTPQGDDLGTLLSELTGLGGDALNDLRELLSDLWFDRDTMEQKYGDDPWFVESSDTTAHISIEWEQMEQSLRDTARLFNPSATVLLEKIFGAITHDRTHEDQAVVVQAGPDHEVASIVRARAFETLQDLEDALSHPESGLGPPPPGIGDGGRMNCAGIPAFYGATKTSTAIAEVRPAVGSYVAIATFKIIRELNLLDLKKLGEISLITASKFDPITVERAIRRNFLQTLTSQLTMPVLPGRTNSDYIITQAIADFLATHPRLNLDGIIFPSTQESQKDPYAKNVVLFRKASTVLHAGQEFRDTARAYLYEYEDDCARFSPTIESRSANSDQRGYAWLPDADRFAPALELDRNLVSIHEIRAVDYLSKATGVKHISIDHARAS